MYQPQVYQFQDRTIQRVIFTNFNEKSIFALLLDTKLFHTFKNLLQAVLRFYIQNIRFHVAHFLADHFGSRHVHISYDTLLRPAVIALVIACANMFKASRGTPAETHTNRERTCLPTHKKRTDGNPQ